MSKNNNNIVAKPKRFSSAASLVLAIVFSIEVMLNAMTLWLFLRPINPDGTPRLGLPDWYVNDFGWLWSSVIAGTLLQLIMLVTVMFIPNHSPWRGWRDFLGILDSITNYFGMFVLFIHVMGFSPKLKAISEYIFSSLTAEALITVIVLAILAELFKQVSHMISYEEKRVYVKAGNPQQQDNNQGGNNNNNRGNTQHRDN